MTTRADMIIQTLQASPDEQFTARDLAKSILTRYPQEMADKKIKSGFQTEEELLVQVTAEIGGKVLETAKKKSVHVATRDIPRPRVYYWNKSSNAQLPDDEASESGSIPAHSLNNDETVTQQPLAEVSLYPLLIKYLQEELRLDCRRIDEKTSSNSHGADGNRWLHPDIVAMERLDRNWSETVRTCVGHGKEGTTRLWSFEVKKDLKPGNVRRYFFQAVSNSSWANFGYLVATSMSDNVEAELQMLCELHGIGLLILNTASLFESQIRFPARERPAVDWLSVNRIVEENADFRSYIEQLGIYRQTGKFIKSLWNK